MSEGDTAAVEAPAAATDAPEVIEFTPMSLDVLTTVKETQAVNGLKHNNFQRYRQFCSRKLRRMRYKLKLTFGRGKGFRHREADLNKVKESGDARYLLIPLFTAERAWAYGMQLKDDLDTFGNPRIRFHMISRMAKAEKAAATFHELALAVGDTRLQLESEGYAAWIRGSHRFIRENWEDALTAYLSAITIFDGLAGTGEQMEQCAALVDEIRTNVEYCEYQIRRASDGSSATVEDLMELQTKSNSLLNSKLNDLLEETRKQQAETMSEISWRGKHIPIRNADIRVSMVAVRQSEQQLSLVRASGGADANDVDAPDATKGSASHHEAVMDAFHAVLLAYSNAQQTIRSVLTKLRAREATQKNLTQIQNVTYLDAHVQYELALLTLKRNEYVISEMKTRLPEAVPASEHAHTKLETPVRIARMYQNLTNNLESLEAVPSDAFDGGVQGDLVNEAAARRAVYAAYRAYWVGRAYAASNEYGHAEVVFESVAQQALSAEAMVSQAPRLDADVVQAVHELADLVRVARVTNRAKATLADAESNADALPPNATIHSHPNMFPQNVDNVKLVEFPPSLTPIPCQPLFFDLASTYLSFPDLGPKLGRPAAAAASTPAAAAAAAEPEPQKQEKKGWFGLW